MPKEPIQHLPPVREVDSVKPPSEAEPAAETVERADEMETSERARELARVQQAVEAAPEVRPDKVAALKKRIDDGTYNVPPEALADKLLEPTSGQ